MGHKSINNILIDLDRLKEIESGLGHVGLMLGKELAKLEDPQLKFTFLVPPKYMGYFGSNVNYLQTSLCRRVFPWLSPRFDLWFTIHQDVSYFPSPGCKYIFTINDLNFIHEKNILSCKRRLFKLNKLIKRAACISAISNNTKKEIEQYLNVQNKPIKVLYVGLELKEFPGIPPSDKKPAKPYFISVGVFKQTKNYQAIIEMMRYVPDYELVMVGKNDTPYGEIVKQLVIKYNLQDRVHLLGLVSEEDKYALYRDAEAVLFPSISEGMGYPPLEGMSVGKPVFVFNVSAIPEVCGSNAFYWKNDNPQAMAEFTLQKLKNEPYNAEKIAQVKAFGKRFSWSETARVYVDLFKEILL